MSHAAFPATWTGHSALAVLLLSATLLLQPHSAWASGIVEPPAGAVVAAVEQGSFEEILFSEAPRDGWRAFEWRDFPGIYVIHFDSYLEQALAFNRTAMYVEKAGQRGTVPTVEEMRASFEDRGLSIEGVYAAHDYRSSDLARFYNSAAQQSIELLPEEQEILDWLEAAGLLIDDIDRGGWRATGRHALLSFATRYQGEGGLSGLLGKPGRVIEGSALQHELRHGLYFTRPEYRQRCIDFWQTRLSESERRAFRLALSVFHYDPTDEELMINEWMAYLLTPDVGGMGRSIFTGRLRAIAAGELRPEGFSSGDYVLIERVGPALAQRVELDMPSELRDWLGSQWSFAAETGPGAESTGSR